MKLQLDRPHVQALAQAFPELQSLEDQLRFGHRIEVASGLLSVPALEMLAQLYADAGAALSGRAAQLRALVVALRAEAGEPRFGPGSDIEALLPAVLTHLTKPLADGGTGRGWLFAANTLGKPLAWVPTRVDFVPGGSEENAKLMIELKAHAKLGILTQTLRLAEADLRGGRDDAGATVAELLAAKGWLKETPELLAACDATAARYVEWRGRYGGLFNGSGIGFHAEDPNATHRDTDWSRKDQIVLAAGGGTARLVNDEGVLPPRGAMLDAPGDVLGPYLRKCAKSSDFNFEAEAQALQARLQALGPQAPFTQLPVHAYLFMFHLELHQHLWVHVDDIEPHVFDAGLKHKLVLPREQTDLIDILTAEMDVLMDDVVAGKGGGTTVLCAGPPGVGKTLTAEVYAEIIGRPLYRVHSGQLGLNVSQMEQALKEALTRAQRWGAVMLIDEADVYIRKRSDDIAANAVVGVFLRVLEYFNGLLFLTTNRIDDIDEAIVSRCIALIRYSPPDQAARERIWRVMAEQFGLQLDAALVTTLAATYPQATGRDIKGLAKLVAKTCRHQGLEPTLTVFARCALFRAMDPAEIA
ncbi:ATP-binding protein [Roseateles cellulosilyticus]|uniref:ATP-binding protein n=1 Tax=Pelomonas cellulosilytica TaxID=2906762 RepID=A0ABS8XYQ1_9BURK|nr:ATP-binding protein [Pelomonas sp. P8]MCE4556790.1 ATP-binding protein [Pelomonas sp. P8]